MGGRLPSERHVGGGCVLHRANPCSKDAVRGKGQLYVSRVRCMEMGSQGRWESTTALDILSSGHRHAPGPSYICGTKRLIVCYSDLMDALAYSLSFVRAYIPPSAAASSSSSWAPVILFNIASRSIHLGTCLVRFFLIFFLFFCTPFFGRLVYCCRNCYLFVHSEYALKIVQLVWRRSDSTNSPLALSLSLADGDKPRSSLMEDPLTRAQTSPSLFHLGFVFGRGYGTAVAFHVDVKRRARRVHNGKPATLFLSFLHHV